MRQLIYERQFEVEIGMRIAQYRAMNK